MKPSSCCWTRWLLPCVIAAGAALLLLWPTVHAGSAVAYVQVDKHQFRVSGPYIHENLAAYLIHSDRPQDERCFITLQEGLDNKWVTVTEKEQEQVGELLVENRSDNFLYLQDGDLLKGGKQDRTIYATHIVPPRTKEGAKSFCVERSRWSEGGTGRAFANPTNLALAPKEIKQAAKFQNDQSAVWANVAEQRGNISANVNYSVNFQTSSFNEARESAKLKADVKQLAGSVADHLRRELRWYPDAVGIAVAVNGRVEEINVYPNRQLLEKISPRLLEAYAEQALLQKGAAGSSTPMASTREIAQFMRLEKEQQVASAAANQPRRHQPAGATQAALQEQVTNVQVINQPAPQRMMPQGQFGNLGGQFGHQGGQAQNGQFGNLGGQFGNLGGQFGMQGGQLGMQGGQFAGQAQPGQYSSTARISFYERTVNQRNGFEVQETSGKYACTTKFEGKTIGYQFTSRTQPQPRVQPNGWIRQGQSGGINQPDVQQAEQLLNGLRQQNFNPTQQPQPQRANPPVRINQAETPNPTPAPRINQEESREALPAPRQGN